MSQYEIRQKRNPLQCPRMLVHDPKQIARPCEFANVLTRILAIVHTLFVPNFRLRNEPDAVPDPSHSKGNVKVFAVAK